MPEVDRLQPAFAVSRHVIGEDRAHQHRHMPGDVMKDVRLLEIIELVAPPDETRRGKAPRGKKHEKHVVRHEPWDRDNAPAGGTIENVAEPAEIRNSVRGNT